MVATSLIGLIRDFKPLIHYLHEAGNCYVLANKGNLDYIVVLLKKKTGGHI